MSNGFGKATFTRPRQASKNHNLRDVIPPTGLYPSVCHSLLPMTNLRFLYFPMPAQNKVRTLECIVQTRLIPYHRHIDLLTAKTCIWRGGSFLCAVFNESRFKECGVPRISKEFDPVAKCRTK